MLLENGRFLNYPKNREYSDQSAGKIGSALGFEVE